MQVDLNRHVRKFQTVDCLADKVAYISYVENPKKIQNLQTKTYCEVLAKIKRLVHFTTAVPRFST